MGAYKGRAHEKGVGKGVGGRGVGVGDRGAPCPARSHVAPPQVEPLQGVVVPQHLTRNTHKKRGARKDSISSNFKPAFEHIKQSHVLHT